MGGRGSSFKDINVFNKEDYLLDIGDIRQDKPEIKQNALTKNLKKDNIIICESTAKLDEHVRTMNLKQIEFLTEHNKSIIEWSLDTEPLSIRSYKMNRISKRTMKKSPEYSVIAVFSPVDKQICFNERVVKDISTLEYIAKSGQETGHSVKTDKNKMAQHTVTHEYGHFVEDCIILNKIRMKTKEDVRALSNYQKVKASPEGERIRMQYAEEIKNQIKQIAIKKYHAKGEQLRTSNYGEMKNDPFEFFAEVFAETQLHTTNKPLVRAMKDYLEEEKECLQ